MGRTGLVCRLAARDIRHRPAQALLLLLVITAAMTVLTLGLILHGVASRPYDQTRADTAGPDVVVSSAGFPGPRITSAAAGRLTALTRAPGVTAHSGPYPVAWPVLRAPGVTARAMAEGRSQAPARVDQPRVIEGTWVRRGGVVVERAFASALGVQVGGRITLDGRPFRVTGLAVTAAVPVFSQVCFYGGRGAPRRPASFDTGLVWVTQAAAPAFVARHQPPPGPGPAPLTAWQTLRSASGTLVAQEQQVLVPAGWLLGLLAMASVAVAAAVLLAQHLAVALAAAGAGLAAGWLAAPLLASPGASLVGSPGTPALTWSAGLLVTAAAVAVAGVSTLVPAVRAARAATVTALAGAARPPRRQGRPIALSAWLPVPLLLGLRLVTRQPRRALLSTASFTVTATTVVAVLIFHATVGQQASRPGAVVRAGGPGERPRRPGPARHHPGDGHPGGRQRPGHHLGGRAGHPALLGHRPLSRRHPRAGHRRAGRGPAAASPGRRGARHPGRARTVRGGPERGAARQPPGR